MLRGRRHNLRPSLEPRHLQSESPTRALLVRAEGSTKNRDSDMPRSATRVVDCRCRPCCLSQAYLLLLFLVDITRKRREWCKQNTHDPIRPSQPPACHSCGLTKPKRASVGTSHVPNQRQTPSPPPPLGRALGNLHAWGQSRSRLCGCRPAAASGCTRSVSKRVGNASLLTIQDIYIYIRPRPGHTS